MAVADAAYARPIVEAVRDFDRNLILIAYGGELLKVGDEWVSAWRTGLRGSRVRGRRLAGPRRKPGAVIHDVDRIVARGLGMITEKQVTAITGRPVPSELIRYAFTPTHPARPERLRVGFRSGLEAAGVDTPSVG